MDIDIVNTANKYRGWYIGKEKNVLKFQFKTFTDIGIFNYDLTSYHLGKLIEIQDDMKVLVTV